MRRRASRFAIFAAVVAAHLLALHFLPDFRVPQEDSDWEQVLPVTVLPVSSARLPARQRELVAVRSKQKKRTPNESKQATESHAAQRFAREIRPWVDWEKEADTAIDDNQEHASEAARRGSALSRWREHVLPGPPPRGPEFRWDEARTSQRFVPTIAGLVIHLNDRCLIIISPLALLGGCAIGHIPAYNDLFAHMDDPKEPGESSVPSNPR